MGPQHIFLSVIALAVCSTLVIARTGMMMSTKPCSTSKVACIISPCMMNKCNAFSSAECRNNYCGGCNAEYWMGTTEVTSQCDQPAGFRSPRVDDCKPPMCFMDPCRSASCPARPSAKCQQHKCFCRPAFWEGNTDVTEMCTQSAVSRVNTADSRTTDCKPINCFMNPCDKATCPGKPAASCKQHKCECKPTFWEGNTEVTDQCQQSVIRRLTPIEPQTAECKRVHCFMNPCEKASCPGKPQASCRQHQCECKATFWEGNTEVSDQCTLSLIDRIKSRIGTSLMTTKSCGAQQTVKCQVSPCDVDTCPEYPQAQCRNNYCGSCSAEYWVGSKEVTSLCKAGGLALNRGATPDVVPRTIPRVPKPQPAGPCLSSCFFPPCRLSYCAAFPDATCVDNYCGGCRAQYYVGNQEVTTMCRDSVPSLSRLFSNGRRRFRSVFNPWMAFMDGLF